MFLPSETYRQGHILMMTALKLFTFVSFTGFFVAHASIHIAMNTYLNFRNLILKRGIIFVLYVFNIKDDNY